MISIFPSEDVNEIFDTIDGLEFNEQNVITVIDRIGIYYGIQYSITFNRLKGWCG
jgi:hypothetical protein